MAKQSFQALFCQKFGCPEAAYEAKAFRTCLYWQGKFLAPVIRRLSPQFFTADLQFIRYLGEATGLREANAEMADFQQANRSKSNFFRTSLRIRVSGRKAGLLAKRLFSAQSVRSNARAGTPPSREERRVSPAPNSGTQAPSEQTTKSNTAQQS